MYRLICNLLLTLIIAISTFLIFILTTNQYPQKQHIYIDLKFDYSVHDVTKEQAITLCTELVGNYKFVFNNEPYSGLSIIPLQMCFINKYQDGWRLLEVMTHEFVHLKYWAINETFAEFMTFKLLYESENQILHDKGKEIAINQMQGAYNKPYDCSWYIARYFEGVHTTETKVLQSTD